MGKFHYEYISFLTIFSDIYLSAIIFPLPPCREGSEEERKYPASFFDPD